MGMTRAMMRTMRNLTAVFGIAALALTGCGSASDTAGEGSGGKLRSTIGAAMRSQGHEAQASLVTDAETRITAVPVGFLRSFRIYQVDGGGPHEVQFTVGVGPDRVVLLTGNGPAFGQMTEADGTRVTDTAQAVALARTYLRVTRSTAVLSYPVENVDQVRFRPNLSGKAAARRDAIVREYRPVIKPPAARRNDDGFTVTAFAVRGTALERHRLEIRTGGAVKDHTKTLADDLPVPYTL